MRERALQTSFAVWPLDWANSLNGSTGASVLRRIREGAGSSSLLLLPPFQGCQNRGFVCRHALRRILERAMNCLRRRRAILRARIESQRPAMIAAHVIRILQH